MADKVRNLATKSSEAARQTAELIEQSVKLIRKFAFFKRYILSIIMSKNVKLF